MLKPVAMAKVAVVGPKPQMETAIATLHELGLVHIQDYAPGDEGFELGSPLPRGSEVSERLLRIRGLLKGARFAPPATTTRFTPENLAALQGRLAEVETELSHLVDRRNADVDALKALAEEETVLRRIQNFPLPLHLLSGYRSVATATGFLPPDTDLGPVSAVDRNAEIVASKEAEGVFVFAAAPRAAERALNEALASLGAEAVELPSPPLTAAARLGAIADERRRLEEQVAAAEEKIGAIRDRHAAAFFALDELLSLEADRSTAPVRFRTTRNSFMIEGWVPRDGLPRLKSALADASKNRVFVTELPTPLTQPWKLGAAAHSRAEEGHGDAHAPPAETPPVALANPRAAAPYVLLTDTYSRPKYTELDPTLFFYVGFPLFYGIMLGDVAYGALLLLLVVTGVFDRVFDFFGFQSKRALNRIFLHCSLSSIAFGFLYAEFFGLEMYGHEGFLSHYETNFGPIPFPLSRFHEVKLLLLLTLAIASIHMLIGLGLGVRNAVHQHGWSQAIKHRGSWLLILVAATLAMAAGLPKVLGLEESGLVVPQPTPFFWTALALLVVGVVLLLMGEGATALFELPTILSNLLSYTRLVAIGLSSAGIALAGNEVSKLAFGAGGAVGIASGVLILLFFHLLNVALGVIGPALHSLRLHYVEFFTKFYEGGGEPYAPFGAERKYTTKETRTA